MSARSLVIIPTVDEASNIAAVLRQVRSVAPDADVLVVDGASGDRTADLAEEVGAELGRIRVLRQPIRNGIGGAYRAGFELGLAEGYDVLVEMDADLSHDPSDLPTLLASAHGGARLAIGSRYVPGGATPFWPWHRLLLSRGGNRYVNLVLGLGVRDATAGFRAFRASTLEAIDYASTRADGYAFQVEMAYRVARTGGGIVEHPITFRDRVRGTSKMSGRIVAEAMLLVTTWAIRDRILRRGPRVGR
ncbi:MAG TPA: polyprenol monophosphomannose synthase [Acidimicrobiales bacterium]|nr:polyprenol monophosphomannose synthase [Acidimicrobiales bacterium]